MDGLVYSGPVLVIDVFQQVADQECAVPQLGLRGLPDGCPDVDEPVVVLENLSHLLNVCIQADLLKPVAVQECLSLQLDLAYGCIEPAFCVPLCVECGNIPLKTHSYIEVRPPPVFHHILEHQTG